METKRCAQCHKLLRVDTPICSRCRYTFTENKRKVSVRGATKQSIPPASPHRAGHYSGLHPEDQPYQSSMIAVQRPPIRETERLLPLPKYYKEPEHIELPIVDTPAKAGVRYAEAPSKAGDVVLASAQTQQYRKSTYKKTSYEESEHRKLLMSGRVIPMLLILSCILFLLASGILVFVLTTKPASVGTKVNSSKLTKQVPVSLTMTTPPVGAINIQNTSLNFLTMQGTNPNPQAFTITNTGDAPLDWIAVESGPGATFAPLSAYRGTLSSQAHVVITVTPKVSTYKDSILATTITISDSDANTGVASQKIPVTITIQQRQAAISVSKANLYLDNSGQYTNASTITITNTGNAPLNWAAVVQTNSSTYPWLSVNNASGTLAPGASKTIVVRCDATHLVSGTYRGSIVINDSDAGTLVAKQTVSVAFAV